MRIYEYAHPPPPINALVSSLLKAYKYYIEKVLCIFLTKFMSCTLRGPG